MATLVEIAAQIVASHASSTPMTSDQLIFEVRRVYIALKNLEVDLPLEGSEQKSAAMTVKEAFKKGEIICMVCGKGGFKTLARHLKAVHHLSPREYKKQFGIPSTNRYQPVTIQRQEESWPLTGG